MIYRLTRAILLYAPLLVLLAVALGLIVVVVVSPMLLIWLAIGTLLLCLAVIAGAVLLQMFRGTQDGPLLDDEIAELVTRIAAEPDRPSLRNDLRARIRRLDEIRLAADSLDEGKRETVRKVLLELGAHEHAVGLAETGSRWERVAAARQLSWLRPDDVVVRLERLGRDSSPDVALAGLVGLAAIPEQAAYEALMRLLDEGTLSPSRTTTFLEESVCDDRVSLLLRLVPGGSQRVRYWGAYLAGRCGDPRLLPLLIDLAADEDADVRANAAEALAAMPAHATLESLLRLSRDKVWFVRLHAARGLAETGRAAVPRLVEMLADEKWWVRENAAAAILQIGEPAIPHLREALSRDDRFARNKAAEILIEMGFIDRELDAFLHVGARRTEARESLMRLGRAEAYNSLVARFLSIEDPRQCTELAELCRDIDASRFESTIEVLEKRAGRTRVAASAGSPS